jgi:nitrate reductase delta subunit
MRTTQMTRGLTSEQLTLAWQSASLLLDYPDEALPARLDLVGQAAEHLPAEVGEPLRRLVDELRSRPLGDLQADYVATFDNRRRCCLFLTYFAHGDTRKRGMALLRFKQAYQSAGFELGAAELPDHLCVVLEFAATGDQQVGRQLMLDHRAGLEVLRLALRDGSSPWGHAVDAVVATLPPLAGDEWDAVRRLAAEGPPAEEVGMTPYGTPELLPPSAPPTGSTVLPMPTFPGAR